MAPSNLDEEFARLAEKVPGFGGLGEAGTTQVYLQDLSRAREVQDLGERVEVRQGEHDFRDLLAWKDALRPLLAEKGAVLLDIEERRNRLVFGVAGPRLRHAVVPGAPPRPTDHPRRADRRGLGRDDR
jgi:hypothetical protein